MSFDQSVVQSVGVLIAMILLATGLRGWGVLKEEYGGIFARLITQYTLPALIFTSLSSSHFDLRKVWLAVVMIVSQVICALLAWSVGFLLKLSRPQKGALILASTFSSSAFLGYAVVKGVYVNDHLALSDAAIVSELGVATVIFTLGILIAIRFGTKETSLEERRCEVIKFFRSPIFCALILGILCSFFPIPRSNFFVESVYKFLHIIGSANTLLVTLTLGVMLHFEHIKKVLPVVLLACLIKLIVQPLLSSFQANLLNFPTLWHQIVVLEAAMPTAAMTAIFSKRYGCDSELTTILIFATFVSSVLTVIMMVFLLG
jgi:predicted permease